MDHADVANIFTEKVLEGLLPPGRADEFFAALYGDADEGVYDITLAFKKYDAGSKMLSFELQLRERPGKCLACNLTYGLPQVFSRHPLINVQGMVEKIAALISAETKCISWELGSTQTPAADMHTIPLAIQLG